MIFKNFFALELRYLRIRVQRIFNEMFVLFWEYLLAVQDNFSIISFISVFFCVSLFYNKLINANYDPHYVSFLIKTRSFVIKRIFSRNYKIFSCNFETFPIKQVICKIVKHKFFIHMKSQTEYKAVICKISVLYHQVQCVWKISLLVNN